MIQALLVFLHRDLRWIVGCSCGGVRLVKRVHCLEESQSNRSRVGVGKLNKRLG